MKQKRFVNIQSIFSIKDNITEEKYKYRHGVLDDRLVDLMNDIWEEREGFKNEGRRQNGQKRRLANYLKQYLSKEEIIQIMNDDKWL